MSKWFVRTLSLVALLVSIVAISGPPAVIAVLDSPVDYDHPEIQAVLDEDLLKDAKIVDENGQEKSWYDLNLEAKAEFEKRLNRKTYAEQVQYIDAMHSMMGSQLAPDKALSTLSTVAKGTIKYIFSPKYRSSLNVVATYLHGTHVAGIAMRSLTSARLITFPIIASLPKTLTLSEILKYDPVKQREQLRQYLEQVSQVLQRYNVRVVNLSIGSSEEIAFKSAIQRATFLQKTVFRGKLKDMATEGAKIFTEELGNFFRSNPNSVFVLAAGNEKKDLTKSTDHSANIEAENVIKVAAIDGKGKIAPFSNRSSSYVDIAAVGTGVTSALVGGGEMHMSGTSQAAPNVTNVLAQILESAPTLSAKELIETLYSKHSTSDTSLASLVANGRVLKMTETATESQPVQASKIKVEFGNTSEGDFQKLLGRYEQQMVAQNLTALDITITKDGIEAVTVSLTNKQGQIEVSVNKIPTTSEGRPKVAAKAAVGGGIKSCKDIFLGK